MKKLLLPAVLLLGAITSQPAYAASVEYGDRPFYGFFLSNLYFTNASNGEYGFGRQTFNTIDQNELIHEMTGNVGLYACAAVDGIYYAIPYHFLSSMQEPAPLPMFSYNIYTGYVEEIGEWNIEGSSFKPSDMTYDIKNDRLLALGYDPVNRSSIYEVDRTSGKFTKLVTLPDTGGVIACDAFGRVFVITVDGVLCQVDMDKNFSMTRLYTLPYSQLSSNQSLEFDLTNNKLYWASNTSSNPIGDRGFDTHLLEITMPVISQDQNYDASGDYSFQNIGKLGHQSRFQGMYIPYATGGFQAPGFATDITAVSSDDGMSCKIDFKAPLTTFGGEELTSLDGFDVYRNGERIYTGKGLTPGAGASYNDAAIPAPGEYRYDIICYSNINGDGPKSPVFSYVGPDRPAAVSDISIDVADDFKTINLSWTAPAEGAQGGAFDPSTTTYDIIRLPDNVVVATDLTGTTYTDRLNRLLCYSYRVESKNAYGSSFAVSREFVAGSPVEDFPVEENFENKNALLLKWTPADNNADGMTWLFGTTLGQSVFGDYETTAEYIISPTSVDSSVLDADEWLISPPIAFGDDVYAIELQIRSLTPETFNIFTGNKNTVESMTDNVGGFELRAPEFNDEDGRMLFQKYTLTLPESIRNTVSCVGIQLATPLPASLNSYVQLGNIIIDTADVLSVKTFSSADKEVSISYDGAYIRVDGDFTAGSVYNANGMKMKDFTGDTLEISDLAPGIYLLNIDGHSFKIVK
ncbi:MAG: T9SS type A sorting domain-containing protein [Muribaculaceae bacterium]